MPAHPLSARERRLTLIAAMLIGAWAAVSWVVEPLWFRARQAEQHVEIQTRKFQQFGDLFAERDAIEQQYQAIVPYLGGGNAQAPAGFLGELEVLAKRADVQVDLKPKPVKQQGDLSRLGVELQLQATQAQLFAFLDALLTMPRLIEVERLQISSAPGQADILRAYLVIEQVTLRQ